MREKLGLKQQLTKQRAQISTRDRISRVQINKISQIHIQDMEQTFRLNSDTSDLTFARTFRPKMDPDETFETAYNSDANEEYQTKRPLPSLAHFVH